MTDPLAPLRYNLPDLAKELDLLGKTNKCDERLLSATHIIDAVLFHVEMWEGDLPVLCVRFSENILFERISVFALANWTYEVCETQDRDEAYMLAGLKEFLQLMRNKLGIKQG